MNFKAPIIPRGKIISLPTTHKHGNVNRIAVSLKNKIEVIDVDRIRFLKSDSNYTEIHLTDDTKIVTSITLKRYADKLCSGDHFIRVHNSYIIHKASLSCYLPKHNKIILHNSREIPVSSSRKEGLLNYLKSLMV